MKKLLILCIASTMITFGWAQGKEKKSKKPHDKEYKHSRKSDDKYEKDNERNSDVFGRKDDNTTGRGNDDRNREKGGYDKANKKYSKNQPAKVRTAFESDYPNATNVRWTKSRGDWTATFNNGILRNRMQATYHANGERRDSRYGTRKNNDQSSVFDRIFKRRD